MPSLLLVTAQKIFAPETLRSAAKQSKRCHVVPVRLRRAIKKFLREQEEPHMKRKVLRLSESFNEIKGIIFGSLLPLPRSSSKIRSSRCNNRSGGRSRARTATSVSSKEMKRPPSYVASRMPAIYSACYTVLREVRRRLPGFSPARVLDFGAGTGSAMWALREIWPRSLERINLVEPSKSMQRADLKDLPLIRSFDSIQALNQNISKCEREHDLVIVSYVLGEIPSLKDRITIVRQLWDLTRDVLVLIEPGTVSYLKCDHIFYGWKKGFSCIKGAGIRGGENKRLFCSCLSCCKNYRT